MPVWIRLTGREVNGDERTPLLCDPERHDALTLDSGKRAGQQGTAGISHGKQQTIE